MAEYKIAINMMDADKTYSTLYTHEHEQMQLAGWEAVGVLLTLLRRDEYKVPDISINGFIEMLEAMRDNHLAEEG